MLRKYILLFLVLATLTSLSGCIVHDPGYYPPERAYYYEPYPYYVTPYVYTPFWFGGYYYGGGHGHGHGGYGGHRR